MSDRTVHITHAQIHELTIFVVSHTTAVVWDAAEGMKFANMKHHDMQNMNKLALETCQKAKHLISPNKIQPGTKTSRATLRAVCAYVCRVQYLVRCFYNQSYCLLTFLQQIYTGMPKSAHDETHWWMHRSLINSLKNIALYLHRYGFLIPRNGLVKSDLQEGRKVGSKITARCNMLAMAQFGVFDSKYVQIL